MTKADLYRSTLSGLADWEPYLRQESGLPGPRGNLELAAVTAEMGSLAQFEAWLADDVAHLEADTPGMYLTFCALVGLGACLARSLEGKSKLAPDENARLWSVLRHYANDPRWRLREAVAMALQRVGDANIEALYVAIQPWQAGTWLEKRAVAAGLAEPRLLRQEANIRRTLEILDEITASIASAKHRNGDGFRALRQCLGYAWSVAVAASPERGAPVMQRWLDSSDADIRWMMKENLKKKRLAGVFTPR